MSMKYHIMANCPKLYKICTKLEHNGTLKSDDSLREAADKIASHINYPLKGTDNIWKSLDDMEATVTNSLY